MSTHRSTTTNRGRRAPMRFADILPVRLSPEGRAAMQSLKRHGAGLNAVASVLTDDPDRAARLIVRAVIACSGDGDLQGLSARLVTGWMADPIVRADDRSPVTSLLMQDVHRLPDDQRASLALCTFGAHTYREAALVLELPAHTVARQLCDAMRSLAAATESGPLPLMA